MFIFIKKDIIKIIYPFIILLGICSINYAQSRLIINEITAPSMENNLLGLPALQTVAIYLPPGYDSSGINYPVVYFLPGFGDLVQYWTNGNYQGFKLKDAMDRLISQKAIKEFIVVIPNGYNFLGGSFYVNSPVTGNCEDFIVKDVVNYIDSNFRTIKNRDSRGISGHSMGGFGALNIAMRHADIFGSVYSLSPGLFDKNGLSNCQLFRSQDFINQYIKKAQELATMSLQDGLAELKKYVQIRFNAADWDTPFIFAYGAAFSPNPDGKLPFTHYPYFISGHQLVVDSVLLKNYENGYGGFSEKVINFKNNLSQLHSITIDYGLNDYYKWIPQGCKYFSDLLTSEGIVHKVETFNGGHEDQVRSRIEGFLLPSFSENLVFDTTLTGIKINNVTPGSFELFQNYPNPFNPETIIRYQIPVSCHVELNIYDMLGRQVAALVNKEQNAGSYEIELDGNNLASGVYLYKIMTESFTQTKKLILLR